MNLHLTIRKSGKHFQQFHIWKLLQYEHLLYMAAILINFHSQANIIFLDKPGTTAISS
jgi:hypothetical protein